MSRIHPFVSESINCVTLLISPILIELKKLLSNVGNPESIILLTISLIFSAEVPCSHLLNATLLCTSSILSLIVDSTSKKIGAFIKTSPKPLLIICLKWSTLSTLVRFCRNKLILKRISVLIFADSLFEDRILSMIVRSFY